MPRSRLPAASRQSRRTPSEFPPLLASPVDPVPSARDLLFQSKAGRLFLVSASLKLVIAALRGIIVLPGLLEVVSTAATIGLALSVGYFVWRLFVLVKRRLLWRVRRKLILSYIFIGVVPALLIITFFMLGAWVVATNVSAYLFRDGYDDVEAHAWQVAGATAAEVARNPGATGEAIAQHPGANDLYPALSVAFVPGPATQAAPATAGDWRHGDPPLDALPPWILNLPHGFAGTVTRDRRTVDRGGDLVVRAEVDAREHP